MSFNRKREQLETLKELSVILNGKCSVDMESCPACICRDLFRKEDWNGWCCYDCVHLFQDYANLFRLVKKYSRYLFLKHGLTSAAYQYGRRMGNNPQQSGGLSPCPCVFSSHFPKELPGPLVVARVEERIVELEEELCIRK